MNCIVNFENVKISGGFSFEIVGSSWTSQDIVNGLKEGTVTMPHMIDGGPLYCDGKIIAKIVKALPKLDFGVATLNYEKNMKVPYFFGFEDKAEVLSYFHDDNDFLSNKEILLATKHMENDGYGNMLVIIKDTDNSLFYTHVEDTIRTRNGPNRFYADNFNRISSEDKKYLSGPNLHFTNEYKEVLRSILTPNTSI